MSRQLARDERAWQAITPLAVPVHARAIAAGATLSFMQARPLPDVECPVCRFESMLAMPLLAVHGRVAVMLAPVTYCGRCVADRPH